MRFGALDQASVERHEGREAVESASSMLLQAGFKKWHCLEVLVVRVADMSWCGAG